MPTSWLDELEAAAVSGDKAKDELEELKHWVQDLSNRVDSFIEECKHGEQDPIWFIRKIQKSLEKKKNEVMGY